MTYRLPCLYLLLLTVASAMAADLQTTLTGRIMDPSDNWLPDVRVALTRAEVVTHTDGNGLFSLTWTHAEPLTADKRGVFDFLELDKEGYMGRSVPIEDLSTFTEPIVERLEPNPIGKDNVGYSERLPANHSLHGLTRRLDIEPGDPISAETFEQLYNREARGQGERRQRVEFHAYVPPDVETVKAAFLISRHGMGTLDHPVLRDFAKRRNVALVGILGAPMQRGFLPVSLIDDHLQRLGEMVGHPELATVPWFTFGHSNGTGFAGILAAERPERTIGWISYHSGGSWHLQFPGIEKVPGLVMHGHLDDWLKHGQERTVKRLRSERQAPVAMMLEGNVGHGPANPDATWTFIVQFCEAVMRHRLQPDGSLKPVDIESGWLGGIYDREVAGQQLLPIAPYKEYEGDKSIANWLIDEAFARQWQTYGNTHPRQAD